MIYKFINSTFFTKFIFNITKTRIMTPNQSLLLKLYCIKNSYFLNKDGSVVYLRILAFIFLFFFKLHLTLANEKPLQHSTINYSSTVLKSKLEGSIIKLCSEEKYNFINEMAQLCISIETDYSKQDQSLFLANPRVYLENFVQERKQLTVSQFSLQIQDKTDQNKQTFSTAKFSSTDFIINEDIGLISNSGFSQLETKNPSELLEFKVSMNLFFSKTPEEATPDHITDIPFMNTGTNTNCAYYFSGRMKCWGTSQFKYKNSHSKEEMSQAHFENHKIADYINLGSSKVIQTISEDSYICNLMSNGEVKCWGDIEASDYLLSPDTSTVFEILPQTQTEVASLPLGSVPVIKMYSNYLTICFLFKNKKVKCLGEYDQIYSPLSEQNADSASNIIKLTDFNAIQNLDFIDFKTDEAVVDMTLKSLHACALFESGRLKCWGHFSSPLGSNGEPNLDFLSLGDSPIKQIVSTSDDMCTLFENGRIKCWGQNLYGELGQETNKEFIGNQPGEMDQLDYINFGENHLLATKLFSIVNSPYHEDNSYCALFSNKKLKCWGYNDFGILGQGSSKHSIGLEKNDILNLNYLELGPYEVVDIKTTLTSICVLLSNHSVKCWGNNIDFPGSFPLGVGKGFLQIGDKPGQIEALKSLKFNDEKVMELYSSYHNYAVLFESGRVVVWGAYYRFSHTPQAILNLSESKSDITPYLEYFNSRDQKRVKKVYFTERSEICLLYADNELDCGSHF